MTTWREHRRQALVMTLFESIATLLAIITWQHYMSLCRRYCHHCHVFAAHRYCYAIVINGLRHDIN